MEKSQEVMRHEDRTDSLFFLPMTRPDNNSRYSESKKKSLRRGCSSTRETRETQVKVNTRYLPYFELKRRTFPSRRQEADGRKKKKVMEITIGMEKREERINRINI
jgi:hypothetical protein